MENKWLRDLRDSMENFEMDAPENLWDDLKDSVPGSGKRRAFAFFKTDRRRVAAAIAAALIAGSAVFFFRPADNSLSLSDNSELNVSSAGTVIEPQYSRPSQNIALLNVGTQRQNRADAAIKTIEAACPAEETFDTAEDASAAVTPAAEEKPVSSVEKNLNPAYLKKTSFPYNNKKVRTTDNGKLSFGVFTSGTPGATQTRSASASNSSPISYGAASWEDKATLGILLYNSSLPTTRYVKHHLPVHTGVNVAYNFNPQIAVETGVSYSYLLTDMRDGSEKHFYNGQQKLHYLGIPLKFKYTAVSVKRLDLYAAAGFTVEKCIDGSLRKEFILDNKLSQTTTEGVPEKPWQLSANASAGLQFNLTDYAGIYAEPGISYYFGDGSSLETIYKEKPFNFSLNIGLRFTIR